MRPADGPVGNHDQATRQGRQIVNEPSVSIARWLGALIVGLVAWVAATFVTGFVAGQLLGQTPLSTMAPAIGLVVWILTVVVGVLAAGRVVGARSVRRWVMVSVLAGGLIVAVTAAIVMAFLNSFLAM